MIVLPFPPASLSGHAKGNSHWGKSGVTKKWRDAAHMAAKASGYRAINDDGKCDIAVHVSFYPPDRRSDRTNFSNRMKPIFDGIAEAIGVNDKRFVPEYHYCPVSKPGRIEIRLSWRPGQVWGEAA